MSVLAPIHRVFCRTIGIIEAMFKNLSDDEKKFVWFWMFVFGSALGFWVLAIRQVMHFFS